MADIFIPTLHTFENGNVFTGSCGLLRFRIEPNVTVVGKDADREHSSIRCELWHGELCYELSEMEAERTFPMSEEGRVEMKAWLEGNADVPSTGER